jgi:uncharacterized protein YdiU (UPF0061 family)
MQFDNSYARELEGAFVPWQAAAAPRPRERFFNAELAAELGGGLLQWEQDKREAVFSGQLIPPGAQPIAQAYAGHQFGGFSPQLGDGRALLLGEVLDTQGRRRDIAFKGSGRTPFSRGGDGKAAVGPMLREVLIGEALHALGIPSTRALAVVATGDVVQRDRALPGAVLTRVADSHLRVGTFEFFAARGDTLRLKHLLDYAVARHAPSPAQWDGASGDAALALLMAVVQRQAALVAQWMGIGFIHGVMNTDNMSISGQSIDFGPCAFMEAHDPDTVYSSIDHHGRYAYGRQPGIAQWNLARLAEALLPVMTGDEEARFAAARDAVVSFDAAFDEAMVRVWRGKLGFSPAVADTDVRDCAQAWQQLLHQHRVDHTLGWRSLLDLAPDEAGSALPLLWQAGQAGQASVRAWRDRWHQLARSAGAAPDVQALCRHNPVLVPRNHQVEHALSAASDEGDDGPFRQLLAAVRRPFDEGPDTAAYARAAPPDVAARHRTFCGT